MKVWVFALLILSHFSEISHENEINLVSLGPNYFIKTGGGGGGGAVRGFERPLNPLWIRP